MRYLTPILLLGILMFGTAAATDDTPASPAVQILSGLIPLAILGFMLWFFLRRTVRANSPYQQRAIEHMDQLERKYDRIIVLLEKIAGVEHKSPEPPPLETKE